MKFRPITDEARNGDSVLLLTVIACVPVVRLGFWDDGEGWELSGYKSQEEARGWWSSKHSVTTEKLEGIYEPTAWCPAPDNIWDWVEAWPEVPSIDTP